jgi:hypothetical protein
VSEQTPIFIISRDRLEPLRALVGWLERAGHERIYIVDNASTFPALLEYLERTVHHLVQLDENFGHLAPWTAGVVAREAPDEWYVVTDPDVVPIEECPPDAVRHFRNALERYPDYVKAGFGLRIDDLPSHYRHAKVVGAWEEQFWRRRFGRNLYHAAIDTTFALYRPLESHFEFVGRPSIRTGYPYLARHLPWYADSANPTPEERYYMAHANREVTNWHGDEAPELRDVPPWSVYRKLMWRAHARFKMRRVGDRPL